MDPESPASVFGAVCDTESSHLAGELREEFCDWARHLHAVALALLDSRQAPGFNLRAILTGDFAEVVGRLVVRGLADEEAAATRPFTTERLGGVVMAKCFAPREDEELYTVVFDDALWSGEMSGEMSPAYRVQVVAHEIAHCVLMQVRGAPRAGLVESSPNCGEAAAAEVMSEAIDEYRADMLSNAILGVVAGVEDGGERRPATLSDVYHRLHRDRFLDLLESEVDPGWADRVQSYRERRLSLDDMWMGLARSAWEAFTSLAHAQAVVDSNDDDDGSFERELAANPAYRLYIQAPWQTVLGVLDQHPLLCSNGEVAAMESELMSAGVKGLVAMWGRLGLTFARIGPGDTRIGVARPQRPDDEPHP